MEIPPKHNNCTVCSKACCCYCSVAQLCLTLCDPTNCSMPGFPVLHYLLNLLKLISMSLRRWYHSTMSSFVASLSSCPQSFQTSGFFCNESSLCIRWPKYWSFSFSISPSKEYSGLISFRIDWSLLAVQRTLKSLLQDHSSKTSILWCSGFFMVQISHPYMTTGKTIALTIWIFGGK